jgi:RES domain-containing protein
MRLWRICRALHADDAFSGEGARLYGGRWSSAGVRVVYTSTSLALAAVETFVNLEPNLRPDDLVSIEYVVPDKVETQAVAINSLPRTWNKAKNESLTSIGDTWVRVGKTLALYVPSAAIRGDWNVLINPAHPEFKNIEIQEPKPFEFDLRMFR